MNSILIRGNYNPLKTPLTRLRINNRLIAVQTSAIFLYFRFPFIYLGDLYVNFTKHIDQSFHLEETNSFWNKFQYVDLITLFCLHDNIIKNLLKNLTISEPEFIVFQSDHQNWQWKCDLKFSVRVFLFVDQLEVGSFEFFFILKCWELSEIA